MKLLIFSSHVYKNNNAFFRMKAIMILITIRNIYAIRAFAYTLAYSESWLMNEF